MYIAAFFLIHIYSGVSKKVETTTKSWQLALESDFYQNYIHIVERKSLIVLGIIITFLMTLQIFFLNFEPFIALVISLLTCIVTVRLSKL